MRNKENKHLGIEIDPELHRKLKYIAGYEGRSINGQILYLVRKCVEKFEKQNGEILKEKEKERRRGRSRNDPLPRLRSRLKSYQTIRRKSP